MEEFSILEFNYSYETEYMIYKTIICPFLCMVMKPGILLSEKKINYKGFRKENY
jgi:hypothetical protein